MAKPIENYTADELSAKIEAIKSERERTANALKRYEEELERRKQEVPLGVPLEEGIIPHQCCLYGFGFASEDSAQVFDGWIKAYVEALQKLAKGEPIDIKVLRPLLPKGWVAMNRYKNEWVWHEKRPVQHSGTDYWASEGWKIGFLPFSLKPAENWETSLMECGL